MKVWLHICTEIWYKIGNFGKRYIKSPKVYFTETGLASGLRLCTPVGRPAYTTGWTR